MTTPVQAGDDASIAVQAQPGDTCKIRYLTPSGTLSTAAGLDDATADASGTCAWTWKIASNTKAGSGEIAIEVRGFKQNFGIEIVK